MTAIAAQELAQAWGELQAIVPISAIHTEAQYDQALEILQALLDMVGEDEQHPLYELLDTLGTLIHSYEEEHQPAPVVTGTAILQFLMAEHQLSQADLPEIGGAAEVAAVLAGQRELRVSEMQALAKRFGISAATFL